VAARQPAPGGGAVSAVTVSLAASLVAMAARYSVDRLDGADAIVDDAEQLRTRAAGLADDDAAAYGAVISAYAARREQDGDVQRERVTAALTRAAEVPLEIAAVAAEITGLASRLRVDGKPDVRGDATTALLLADAATRAAAHLVAANVEAGGGDADLARRAMESVATSRTAASGAELPNPRL
jgi:formiminotetrahydrofolate cyclodeaminase